VQQQTFDWQGTIAKFIRIEVYVRNCFNETSKFLPLPNIVLYTTFNQKSAGEQFGYQKISSNGKT